MSPRFQPADTPANIPGPGPVPHPAGFAVTDWSAIYLANGPDTPEMRQALARLCETYWYPLYAFVRRHGHPPEEAQDLTQEFFASLLEHHWLVRADKSKGRFRSFLLMVLKRFLANEWDKARAEKRGGQVRFESFSYVTAETTYASAVAAPSATPDLQFEREWAVALLELALRQLEQEYAEAGKADLFARARACLLPVHDAQPYAAICTELGMTEAAFKMSVSRMRARFRERLRAEVARTVADPADINGELRHLLRVLARS